MNARYVLLIRIFIIVLGSIASVWGAVEFPIFWQQSSIERTASRIINGDPFKVQALVQQLASISSIEKSAFCQPAALRSAAIVQLRIVETGSANRKQEFYEQLKLLGEMIRSSISCAPADPFLLLALYSEESATNGFRSDYLKYLRMSYQLGPNEGWIALKRNLIAFATFEHLPPDLADNAIDEFIALIQSGFYEQTAEIFTGPAWRVRSAILPRLNIIPDWNRKSFVKAVDRLGYNIDLSGTEKPELHP